MTGSGSRRSAWFRELQSIYLSQADDKIGDISRALDTLADSPTDETCQRRLRRLLHNMVGNGGSYGFPLITEAARQMHTRLREALNREKPLDSQVVNELRGDLAGISRAFAESAEAFESEC